MLLLSSPEYTLILAKSKNINKLYKFATNSYFENKHVFEKFTFRYEY